MSNMTLYEKLMKNKQSIRWRKVVAENLNLDYCEKFLNFSEATALLDYMENNVQYLDGRLTQVKVFGVYHPIPRQQVAFGDEGVTYKFSGTVVAAQPWPRPVLELKKKISSERGVDYNFVLVNRYRNGDDHMGEHRDDEPELDKTISIASVSLGQTRKFVLKHGDVKKKLRKVENVTLDLHHGSLLFMNWPTNEYWYHSIPKEKAATKGNIIINPSTETSPMTVVTNGLMFDVNMPLRLFLGFYKDHRKLIINTRQELVLQRASTDSGQ